MLPPPPTSTLFPYTTLFRSLDFALLALDVDAAGGVDLLGPQDVAGLLRGLSARREGPRARNGVADLDRRRVGLGSRVEARAGENEGHDEGEGEHTHHGGVSSGAALGRPRSAIASPD